MTDATPGRLTPAGEIDMYVEIDGEGPVLVLLHGGGGRVEDLDELRTALRPGRRIIAPEQRAHGRTPDVGGLSFTQMAADTEALLDGLGVHGADVVGWSDGGIVALTVAHDRPDLVGRVVTIGSNVSEDGAPDALSPEAQDWAANATPADLPFEVSAQVGEKILAMWRAGPEITLADLSAVRAPVLLISGDRDLITLEHTLAMYRALPDAQLAVVPGGDHLIPRSRPGFVGNLIRQFLDGIPSDATAGG